MFDENWEIARVRQLRHFDHEMTEFRHMWEAASEEDRKRLRVWLEKAAALSRECPWNMDLRVDVNNEEFDDEGEQIYGGYVDFAPSTLLAAIDAWEKGQPFTPGSVLP